MNIQSKNDRLVKNIVFLLGMVLILAGGGILAGKLLGEKMTGPIFLFTFSLVFLGLFLLSRKNNWAIIPGGFFLSAGMAASLDNLMPDSKVTGPVFLFTLAASFFVLVVLSKRNWWAIIPGGLFFSIGLVVMLNNFIPNEDFPGLPNSFNLGFYVWVLILGLAATFGTLWLMRKSQSTDWAKYPAVGLLTIAIMAFILGSYFRELWLVSVVLGAGMMLILSFFSKRQPESD